MKARDMTLGQHTTIEAAMSAVGSKATYTGAGACVMGGLLSSELGVLVGLFLGVAGFGMNWYYKHKQDKREQQMHDFRMTQQ